MQFNFCGRSEYIELYHQESGQLELSRVIVNQGDNCGVIIYNDIQPGWYFIRIHEVENFDGEFEYSFKLQSFRGEIFSKSSCDCP